MSIQHDHSPYCQRDVIRRFDQAARTFADSDFVYRHTFDGLIERMQPMQLKVERILDLGSAIGAGSRRLAKSFRRSRVVSLDISTDMLKIARRNRSRFARVSELRADAIHLPLVTGSIDLICANMLLPWVGQPEIFFAEIARVLRSDGLFVYSTLGPASLGGLRRAWGDDDRHAHVGPFIDMHNVADAIVRAGLRDPIVDVDSLFIDYRDLSSLFRDLTAAGARNCLRARFPGLTGRHRFTRMKRDLQDQFENGVLSIELELIYGHAWGNGPLRSPGEIQIDPSQIGRRQR